ncbi:hypothetical protein ES703_81267 [subsurface metagenome]
MNITEIISVSPVNPAHGRHEVHANTAENVGVAFQITRDALGCLTAYFDDTIPPDAAYAQWLREGQKKQGKAKHKKGS